MAASSQGTGQLTITGGVVHDGRLAGVRQLTVRDSIVVDDETGTLGGMPAVLDASGCSVLPGFIDLQVNGAVGVDLTTQPELADDVAAFLAQCGVTSYMPTIISSSADDMAHAIDVIGARDRAPGAARSLGVHLEGPFLAPARAGAHPPHHLRPPSLEEVSSWLSRPGVAMVTLAPELPGAHDVIAWLARRGVVVCAGHTAVDPSGLSGAIDAGLRGATHLFNAMGPMSARDPGPAGAVIADGRVIAGLIVDGLHVAPTMVRVAWKALGAERIALVTDSMAALGLAHGDHVIGETPVSVDETGARTSAGLLAGSVLRFDEAVRNLVAFTGCALADASVAASLTPARLAGRTDIGRLSPGCRGDVVVLDDDLEVVATVIDGTVAFDRDGRCTPAPDQLSTRRSPWRS